MQGYSLYACPTGSSITIPAQAQLFTINAAFALPGLIHIDLWNSQTLKLLDRAVIYNGGGPVSGSSTWIKSIINPNITIEPGKTCLFDGADSLNFGLTQDETIYSWSIDGKGSWTGSAASVDYASIRALGIDPGYHNLTLNMKANAYSTDSYYDEFGYHEGTRHYYDVLSSDTVQIFVPAPEPCSILLLASGLLLCRKKFK
jgi:hypothetical protein